MPSYVDVIYGSPTGPTTEGIQSFTAVSPGVPGGNRGAGGFGFLMSVSDMDADGFGDLAIGSPSARVTGESFAGNVTVLSGSPEGAGVEGAQVWSQASPGIAGKPEGVSTRRTAKGSASV